MRLLSRLMEPWTRKADSLQLMRELYTRGASSATGRVVNYQTALRLSTALACARVIANGVGQVPLKLMRSAGVKRLPATDHSLYPLLNAAPSPYQTAFEFFTSLVIHVVFTGNAFAFLNKVRGEIREIWLLDTSRMTISSVDGRTVAYKYRRQDGSEQLIAPEAIWHVRGPSWNTWAGLDCIDLARESIGLSLAIEEHQSQLHANGAQTGGFLTVEGTLKEPQYQALRDWLEKEHTGARNAGRPMIMDRAAKFTPNVTNGVDGQHLETRGFQIEEVCRAFGVMPIMVGHSDKASTYASAEQMFLAHVVHTLAPWYTCIEQSIDQHLLTADERKAGLYSNFTEEGLLRGSLKDTKDMILGYVNGGLMTVNEGRALLDLNPMDDGKSDDLRIPANIVGEPDTPAVDDTKPKDEQTAKAISDLRAEFKDALMRIASTPQPAPINVDARTTVTAAPVTVNVPAPEVPAINVDARNSITVPEQPPAAVVVQVANERTTEQVIERDADGEIKSIKTTTLKVH